MLLFVIIFVVVVVVVIVCLSTCSNALHFLTGYSFSKHSQFTFFVPGSAYIVALIALSVHQYSVRVSVNFRIQAAEEESLFEFTFSFYSSLSSREHHLLSWPLRVSTVLLTLATLVSAFLGSLHLTSLVPLKKKNLQCVAKRTPLLLMNYY